MGERERDEDSGQFSEEYPPELFLEAIRELGSAGTTDISEYVGCDRRTAYLKLQTLEDEEKVESQKVGNALLWRVSE